MDKQKNIFSRNNVRVFGQGKETMMFAHGFGCDQNMWRYILPAFQEKYRIVLFDYVGSGQSDLKAYNRERYGDLNGYAQDVLDICAALDLEKVIFVGHSVSCMVGVLAALKAPHRIKSMIMVGPSPCYINQLPEYVGGFERKDIEGLLEMMEKNFIGWANFLAPNVIKNPDRPELAAELTQSFCTTNPAVARQFAEVTFFSDNRKDLGKVKVPTLLMQCSDDLIAPREVGEYLHRHIPGSTLVIMKATGHCPHMSEPEETIQVIKEFLSGLPHSNTPTLKHSI